MDHYKNRRRTVLAIGVICVAILSGMLLTSGLTKKEELTTGLENNIVQANEYDTSEI